MKWMRTYYNLDAAAEIVGCKAVDLLHFAVQQKFEIMFAIPDFIDLQVFLQDETIALPPFIGLQPRLLVLTPEACLQIELNKTCLQCDFRNGYVVNRQGGFDPMPTHYGRPQLTRTRCYWRTFKEGSIYFNEISTEQLVIKQEDLQRLLEHPEMAPQQQSTEVNENPDPQPRKRRPRQAAPKDEPTASSSIQDGADRPAETTNAEAKATKKPSVNVEHSETTPVQPESHGVPEKNELLTKVLRKKQVKEMTGLSYSTIYAKLNPKSKQYDPTFPKQFRISAGIVGWDQSEIVTWLQARRDLP